MGLLDQVFSSPSDQALWALGSGLFGVRAGREGIAFQHALDQYNAAQQEQRRNKLTDSQLALHDMQVKAMQQKISDDQAMRDLFKNPSFVKPGQPEIRGNEMDIGQPAQPAGIDRQKMIGAMLASGNPALIQKAMELSTKSPLQKVGKGEALVDPDTNKAVFTNAETPEQWEDIQKLPDGRILQRNKATGEVKLSGGASTNVTVGLQSPYAGVDSQGNPIVVQPANRPGVPPQVLTGPDGRPIKPPPVKDQNGLTPENAGKVALMERGVANVDAVDKALFVRDESGKIVRMNRALVANLNSPLTFGSEGRSLKTAIKNAVEAKLRLETGAAATQPEIERVAQRFMPTPMDTAESAKYKLDELRAFFSTALGMTKGAPERTGSNVIRYDENGKRIP